MKISEKDRNTAFAVLAVVALAAVAYVFFLAPADNPSDWQHFISSVDRADKFALFLDARGADAATSTRIYQCGADIIISGKELFGSKNILTFACDDSGCASAQSAANASRILSVGEVLDRLPAQPYVLVKAGTPSTRVFERHVEISFDSTYAQGCNFNISLGK